MAANDNFANLGTYAQSVTGAVQQGGSNFNNMAGVAATAAPMNAQAKAQADAAKKMRQRKTILKKMKQATGGQVQNRINALKANGNLTPAQQQQLAQLRGIKQARAFKKEYGPSWQQKVYGKSAGAAGNAYAQARVARAQGLAPSADQAAAVNAMRQARQQAYKRIMAKRNK